jgi:hypothetical protein
MLHDSDACTLRWTLSAWSNQKGYAGQDMQQQAFRIRRIIHKFWLQDLNLSDQLRLVGTITHNIPLRRVRVTTIAVEKQ